MVAYRRGPGGHVAAAEHQRGGGEGARHHRRAQAKLGDAGIQQPRGEAEPGERVDALRRGQCGAEHRRVAAEAVGLGPAELGDHLRVARDADRAQRQGAGVAGGRAVGKRLARLHAVGGGGAVVGGFEVAVVVDHVAGGVGPSLEHVGEGGVGGVPVARNNQALEAQLVAQHGRGPFVEASLQLGVVPGLAGGALAVGGAQRREAFTCEVPGAEQRAAELVFPVAAHRGGKVVGFEGPEKQAVFVAQLDEAHRGVVGQRQPVGVRVGRGEDRAHEVEIAGLRGVVVEQLAEGCVVGAAFLQPQREVPADVAVDAFGFEVRHEPVDATEPRGVERQRRVGGVAQRAVHPHEVDAGAGQVADQGLL